MFNRKNAGKIVELHKEEFFLILTGISGLIAYSLYAVFPNLSLLTGTLISGNLSSFLVITYELVAGFPATVSTPVFLLATAVSVAVGVNVSVLINTILSSSPATGSAGSLGGVVVAGAAPACAACTAGAVTLVGLSIPIGLLPFNGIEINLFVLAILLTSSFYLLEQSGEVCRVNFSS